MGRGRARSWWTPRSTGSTPPIPLCGGGWPSTPQSTDWGCTSTSLRPSRSTRPAWSGGARPPSRPWTGAGCGTAAAHWRPTASTPREEDWALMAEKGISCVHNPWSNLKLGSGVAPIPAMMRAGVNVALGTDGMSLPQQCRSLLRYQAGRRPAQRGGAGPHGRECLGRPGDGHRQRRPGPGQGYRGHRPGKDGGPDPGGPLRPQSHPLSRPGGGTWSFPPTALMWR